MKIIWVKTVSNCLACKSQFWWNFICSLSNPRPDILIATSPVIKVRWTVNTSLNSNLSSLVEWMVSVSQPRFGSYHHCDFELVGTLSFGKHRVKVVCYLKKSTSRKQQKQFTKSKCNRTEHVHTFHVFYLFLDHSRVHVRNLPNWKLSSNLSRDDSLSPRVWKGPLNTVDGDCGVAPHVSQQVHLWERDIILYFH